MISRYLRTTNKSFVSRNQIDIPFEANHSMMEQHRLLGLHNVPTKMQLGQKRMKRTRTDKSRKETRFFSISSS